ncbi:MAG: undecaprenyl-diphosphate phosphatase [Candidatus Omnitrophica bacterium]|nr:undecaprenyl-diphosphate phosphatase [Candidatus Omnitrophota bacterium]
MKLIDAFILGAVQGIAEWLPVSSSGHLAVFHHLFGLEGNISFDVFLHLSSLCVILIFFRRDIFKVAGALFTWNKKNYDFRVAVYIICATAVTVAAGLLLKPHIELFSTLKFLPFAFLLTSLLLFASLRRGSGELDAKKAFFIGLIQGIALLPGVSRSGATISAGKIAGIKNEEVFRFSFLMAIPAIAGAIVYEMKDFSTLPLGFLLTGFITSFVLGLCFLYVLKRVFLSGRMYLFGFYTLALSILLFIAG